MINDTNCEQIVIATMLNFGNNFAEINKNIDKECFTEPKYQNIYEAILKVYGDNKTPDIINVSESLMKEGSYITSIDVLEAAEKPCLCDIEQYVMRLRELARRRNLSYLGYKLVEASNNELDPTDELLSQSIEILEGALVTDERSTQTLNDATKELYSIINMNLSGTAPASTKTGFSRLDQNGGFHPGDLVVIGGSTSQGKTSLSLTIALNAMYQNHKVAFYSMEMMKHQLAARLVSMESKVSSSRILYGKPTSEELSRIDAAVRRIPMSNLLIDDKATSNIETIIGSIRYLHKKEGIKGAFIDYLQILNVNMNASFNKEQLMAECARRLKNLAKDLGIWIVALTQLNRNAENPEPSNDRVRDSGQVVEAADTAIMIYRPETFGRPYPKPFDTKSTHNTAMIKITKGRNIGTFDFVCGFIPELTLFTDTEAPVVKNDDVPF